MKKFFSCLLLIVSICSAVSSIATGYTGIWTPVNQTSIPADDKPVITAANYLVYSLDINSFQSLLLTASNSPDNGLIIDLPLPGGTFRTFKVWSTIMMEAPLAAKYPNIHTFNGFALDDPRTTLKADLTPRGFHAMIFDGANTAFIDPYSHLNDGYYMCHYKRDETRLPGQRMICGNGSLDKGIAPSGSTIIQKAENKIPLNKITNGPQSRTYRLALACSDQYAIHATSLAAPSKADVLSCMVTSMNRINGVYERELSVSMIFVANEDTLIFTAIPNDPFYAINPYAPSLIAENQIMCDSLIGNANYDIGHVFTTGAGGLSQLGCACNNTQKAESATGQPNPVGDGFDIDFVAHEMGHEFGANHPFNDDGSSSCSGNAYAPTAYEPGSGSTVMAYAGICSPDDIQPHSDAYFHAISLKEITEYITTGIGSTCPLTTTTNNKFATLPTFLAHYSIPYLTPFEITAPGLTDSSLDTLNTYCWEQYNLGDFGSMLINTHLYGPIFRSFNPDTSRTRVFPKLDSILVGTTSYAGFPYEDKMGEKLPDTGRFLTFKLSVRSIYNGFGAVLVPDDTVHADVINTGRPFTVTTPSTGDAWVAGYTHNIVWDVANTTLAPISCDSVIISLSVDGGYTYPYILSASSPNTGIASVILPLHVYARQARVKVKGAGNIFFNLSKSFTIDTITNNSSAANNTIRLFPVPVVANTLNIFIANTDNYSMAIFNAMGQSIYQGQMSSLASFNLSGYSKGMYFIRFLNQADGSQSVKKFVLE